MPTVMECRGGSRRKLDARNERLAAACKRGRKEANMEDNGSQAPDIWGSAKHNKIPEDHWEYQMRKRLNDPAYQGLDYVPYCSTMPVQAKCDDAKFIWIKKKAK